ncbi:2-phosphosulfolactate phosphatase [Fodinibius halophilus]|uniref:Probable 2-phosphosulfolactate phosphatase n=1 Tax=Fodinibius halophilus TaxID=1736908 RepID=A0A6M1T5K1_9BACT|nr:2-phosphosulfolactate phosphatase [Fodinibius halophilus]NGP87261.1 2-phosphosulfolactate phosphatase [Fodinibius halophilus]
MIDTLDVFSSAHSFQEEDLRDKTVVMIDVLRASSTMITALHHGAKGVIPVGDMGDAGKISHNLDSESFMLSGEKNGVKIDGYDLTNSPLEHTGENVVNKTVILNTTNGTKAIKRSGHANRIIIGAFLNLATIIDHLKEVDEEVVLVCAGWRGRLSFEDLLCAGNIIYELSSGKLSSSARDAVKVAFGLYEKFADDIEGSVKSSNYAERLKDVVSEEDISYCCQRSTLQVLPVLNEGIITDFNDKEK